VTAGFRVSLRGSDFGALKSRRSDEWSVALDPGV
jgi:hypothetical protein